MILVVDHYNLNVEVSNSALHLLCNSHALLIEKGLTAPVENLSDGHITMDHRSIRDHVSIIS
jgi:hypothetical protein